MKQCFYIITLSLIVILTSCKREHKPDNLLDTATMTAIMSEYYIIEGYDYMVASRYQDSIGFQSRAAKDSLLKRFNISQADFDSSLAYYIRHQRVFEPMMERVIKNLDDSIRQNQPNNDTVF